MHPCVAVTVFLLLAVCSGAEGRRLQKREEPAGYLEQVQGMLSSSQETISSWAQHLLDKVKEVGVEQRLMEMYNKGSSAVGTYTNILSDQIYHMWQGA
ncbi:apolipoprotein C-II [Lissotriton helveticus]